MSPEIPSAEAQLRLSEESFRTLIEESPDAIAVHRDGRFLYVNRQCTQILGYPSADALVGQPVSVIVHADHRAAVADRLRALDAGATAVPFSEERLLRFDGASITVEIAAMRVVFQGKPAIAAVARDLSARMRRDAEAALAVRMAGIGLLAAGVAHEINNPLTFVMLHLENLARNVGKLRHEPRAPRAEEWDAFAKAIEEARFGLERVGSIVRDLRTFARHDEGEPDLVSITRILDTAINLTGHELKYRAKVVRRGDETQAYVIGREGKLCQVFVNLLVNAAQALSVETSDVNEVLIETLVLGTSVQVTVSDNGPGIPNHVLGRIFEPFVTTKQGTGSGLGLPISRDIVVAHGGTIVAANASGSAPGSAVGGAVFTVVLPHAAEQAAPRSSRNLMSVAAPALRARVLVVDDEPSIVSLVAEILSETYDLEVARTGREAEALLADDRRFDLILCDVMMPLHSGLKLHAWLESEVPELAGRVLFMSGGDPGPGLAERSPDRFLAKPFTRHQLEKQVARALSKLRK